MFAALLLPLVAAGPVTAGALPNDPPIELWINNDRRFLPGDGVQVRVRTKEDGYLVVLHADPDGRVRVLFPLDPRDDNFVRGGKRYEVRGRADRDAFEASVTGHGMVYAAVSHDPFHFERYALGDHWDYRTLAPERLPREPEAELTELVRGMAQSSFDYDVLTYDVIERVYTGYYHRPYRHWAIDALCDPYYYDYYCRPYYRSYFSVALTFGRPYDRYYYGYDPFFYDPFYSSYSPVYVYPRRYYGYSPYWYSPRRPYYGPVRSRSRGFDDYRDRRYTFARGDEGYRWPSTVIRGTAVPARRTADRLAPPPESGRPTAGRRPVEARSRPSDARAAEPGGERRPVERRDVEARRAREGEPRQRPDVDARPAERAPEARRVTRDRDDSPRDERNVSREAQPSRRDDPRDDRPEPRAEPRHREDGGGGGDRGAARERGGDSRSSRSEGRGGGGGGGRGGGGRRR